MNSEVPTTAKKSRPRPLSPHIGVYSWLITSTTSIFHRLSGVLLAGGMLVFTYWLITIAFYPENYESFSECARSPIGIIALIGFTASLYYHLLNGIRHLLWDAIIGINVKTVNVTGWLVIIGAGVLTALTWACVYGW